MRTLLKISVCFALLFAACAQSAGAATPSVRVATDYACALAQAGTVSCWGGNARGQLGDGTRKNSPTPVAVKDVSDAVQIDAGMYGACALIADGTVKCWGATIYGALGTSSPAGEYGTATTIAGISGATKISVGEATICAILSSPAGAVKCWGYGAAGQLGVSSPPSSTGTPQTVSLGGPATDVAVSEFHACAVVATALKCWGGNNYKQILNTATSQYDTPQTVPALSSGVALAAPGNNHTCAVMLSGAVKCWGTGSLYQDGTGVVGSSTTPQNSLITAGATAVGYGSDHRCALLGDSVRCWGRNYRGQLGDGTTTDNPTPLTPSGMGSGVSSVDSGGDTTCAIVAKSVMCWGDNAAGALGNGGSNDRNVPVSVAGVTAATAVDVSQDHACAVESGQLKCWGDNSIGALGTGSNGGIQTSAVAATTFGPGQSAVATSKGTTCTVDTGALKCVGYGYYGQLGNNTSSGSTPSAVAATILTTGMGRIAGGYEAFCGSPTSGADTGKVFCWGHNYYSVLGQGAGQDSGTLAMRDEPTFVPGIASGTTSIAVGYRHACAVVSGSLRCWGQNDGGDVTGAATSAEYPAVQTPGLSSVNTTSSRAVAVSYGSTCAIVTSPAGGIKCFGQNNLGTLGDGTTTNSLTPVNVSGITGATAIAGSDSAFCAVVSGSVRCWGRNDVGQLGNGTNAGSNSPVTVSGITTATSIAGGSSSFCALLSGGSVKCWGDGYFGQLGAGAPLYSAAPSTVAGLSLFPPDPPVYIKQKVKPTLKLNGKVKRKGSKIAVPLKLSYSAPAGSSTVTVCGGTATISVKTSKEKTAKLKAKFKRVGSTCRYKGTFKLPKALKGKKAKFKISLPGNADLLAGRTTKTLRLK